MIASVAGVRIKSPVCIGANVFTPSTMATAPTGYDTAGQGSVAYSVADD